MQNLGLQGSNVLFPDQFVIHCGNRVLPQQRLRGNERLGKPVVKHLRILRVGKVDRGDRAQWRPENLPVSKPNRKDWPGPVSDVAPNMAQVIGRPYAKYFGRKHGKVA